MGEAFRPRAARLEAASALLLGMAVAAALVALWPHGVRAASPGGVGPAVVEESPPELGVVLGLIGARQQVQGLNGALPAGMPRLGTDQLGVDALVYGGARQGLRVGAGGRWESQTAEDDAGRRVKWSLGEFRLQAGYGLPLGSRIRLAALVTGGVGQQQILALFGSPASWESAVSEEIALTSMERWVATLEPSAALTLALTPALGLRLEAGYRWAWGVGGWKLNGADLGPSSWPEPSTGPVLQAAVVVGSLADE